MMTNKYPLPLYLNQKYVFDTLSMMEGGFSQFETVTRTESDAKESTSDVSGEVGVRNVFAFLGVSLGGHRRTADSGARSEEVVAERVHTPNSLFAKMRERLYEDELVASTIAPETADTGSFVEIRARLEKNPLVEALESLRSILNLAVVFDDRPGGAGQSRKQRQSRQSTSESHRMLDQMSEFLNQLGTGQTIDLLAQPVGDEATSVILTVDVSFATDASLSDLVDGEYAILGKITRAIRSGSSETINLLRKTSLGRIHTSLLDELKTPLAELEREGLALPALVTEVQAPAVQVLPIAIFA